MFRSLLRSAHSPIYPVESRDGDGDAHCPQTPSYEMSCTWHGFSEKMASISLFVKHALSTTPFADSVHPRVSISNPAPIHWVFVEQSNQSRTMTHILRTRVSTSDRDDSATQACATERVTFGEAVRLIAAALFSYPPTLAMLNTRRKRRRSAKRIAGRSNCIHIPRYQQARLCFTVPSFPCSNLQLGRRQGSYFPTDLSRPLTATYNRQPHNTTNNHTYAPTNVATNRQNRQNRRYNRTNQQPEITKNNHT